MTLTTPPGAHHEAPDNVDDAYEQPFREAAAILDAAQAEHDPELDRGLVRRFFDDLKSLGELRHTPYGMRPLVLFSAIGLFGGFSGQAYALAGPIFTREYGIKINSIISVRAIVGTIAALASLAVGYYADRHRRVPLYAAGTTANGLADMTLGYARTTLSLGTPVVAGSIGGVAAGVPGSSLLADYYPVPTRGRVFSFLGLTGNISAVLTIVTVGPMLDALGLESTFLILGVPSVLMGILAFFVLKEPVRGYFERKLLGADEEIALTEEEPQSFGEGWRATFAVRTIRRLFVSDLIVTFAGVTSIFFPFFLAEVYGLSATEQSLIALPSVLTGIIGGVYGGGLIDRFTLRNPGRVLVVYGVFFIIPVISQIGYAIRPPLALMVVFSAIASFGGSLVGPSLGAVYSQVIPPSVRTQGLQATRLAGLPASLVGLPIVSIINAQYGYGPVFMFAVPFYIIGGIVAMTAGSSFDIDRRNAFAQALAAEEWRRAKEAGSTKLLVCRSVDVAYDGVQVLFGVDLDIAEGELLALLGTNGAGKSTLLRALSGVTEASGGAVIFDGRDITHMPPHEIAAKGVVHMPGGKGVFPGLSVHDNLLLGNWLAADLPADEQARRIAEAYEIFPALRERKDQLAGLLSGGQQQQLSLAQAFLMQPRLLAIDELSLGLSPVAVGELLEIVREIHRRGVTVVVVEQSVNVALTLAQRAIFMEKGEIKFDGPTADLLRRPDILRAVYVKGTGGAGGTSPGEARQRRQELAEAPTILEVTGAVKRYGGVTAVDHVDLTLREGEVLGLIGPNGSGKTTMFDLISGYQPIDGGRIVLAGIDVTNQSPEARAKLGLVRRFQDARQFPSLTVFETLLVSLEQQMQVRSTFLSAIQAPQARRAEKRARLQAERYIELLGLGAFRDKFVKELSTGLRRVLDLACVLAAEPKVLLLDEPSSGIAQAEAEGLAPLLRRVRFETGCSMLIIEHDMPLISNVSDELIAMDRGAVVLRGRPDRVLNDERVITSYLGGDEAAVQRSGSRA